MGSVLDILVESAVGASVNVKVPNAGKNALAAALQSSLRNMGEDARAELATLRSQLAARTEALHRIAFEPFGHAEASASEVLDAVTDCARTALSGTAQTDDVLAALTDLHDACVPAYKMGRIPAEPFVRAGNVLRARASLAQWERKP